MNVSILFLVLGTKPKNLNESVGIPDNCKEQITDDGPGFTPFVLDRIGEPYISLRMGKSGHMGLGIFIAQTLLARTGAEVSFGNQEGGGAFVIIRWPRAKIENV